MTTVAGDPERSADSQAVLQLVLRERQSRDRGWWDDLADCFADDAMIEMSWFTGLAKDFIQETRDRSIDGVWGRHRLSPPTIRLSGDRAWAELPLGIEFDTDVDGVAADLVSDCRSQYRARRGAAGIWRLERITSIYERDTLTPARPGSQLSIDPASLDRYRTSYCCLAWYFDQRGASLPDDLLGDDVPGPVAHHYAANSSLASRRKLSVTQSETGERVVGMLVAAEAGSVG